jgi:hypothetical protein
MSRKKAPLASVRCNSLVDGSEFPDRPDRYSHRPESLRPLTASTLARMARTTTPG